MSLFPSVCRIDVKLKAKLALTWLFSDSLKDVIPALHVTLLGFLQPHANQIERFLKRIRFRSNTHTTSPERTRPRSSTLRRVLPACRFILPFKPRVEGFL